MQHTTLISMNPRNISANPVYLNFGSPHDLQIPEMIPQMSPIESQTLYQKLLSANRKAAQLTKEKQVLGRHVEELKARLEKKELLLRDKI